MDFPFDIVHAAFRHRYIKIKIKIGVIIGTTIWRLKLLRPLQGLNIIDFITRPKFNNNRVLLNFPLY